MDYAHKNKGFLTSHKLKAFRRCAFCYHLQYEQLEPNPMDEFGDKDYFVIGQAVDDYVTHGNSYYDKHYEVVSRRGESEKTQLTKTMGQTVDACVKEYGQHPLFDQKPKKKILELQYNGIGLRAELDHYNKKGNVPCADIKTTANVKTYDPDLYVWQFSFYHWLIEIETGINYDYFDAYVVDKQKIPRSRCIRYRKATLEAQRPTIIDTIDKYIQAKTLDIWDPCKREEEAEQCDYYGYPEPSGKPHGHILQPIIW